MTHTLPPLPYAMDKLEPNMSARTLEYHYGKHLQAYLNNLNNLIPGTPYQDMKLEQIIVEAPAGGIFNNAAQSYNHIMFFESLSPTPQTEPSGALKLAIERDFGSLDQFKEAFNKSAQTLFGSGWVYLAADCDGKLEILAMPNAENPMTKGRHPLMCIDVWEHSYYLDYQNRRPDYIQNFWKMFDWKYAEKRFAVR